MSRQVLFRGAVIIRPGAATYVDVSAFNSVQLAGIGIAALIGLADGGQPGIVQTFQSPRGVANTYRSGDIVEAAAAMADPSNDNRIQNGPSLFVCVKLNRSTQASLVEAPFTFLSRDWGAWTNSIKVGVDSPLGGTDRVVNVAGLDVYGNTIQEVSPALGTLGKFALQYLGTAGKALMTITGSQISLTTAASSGLATSGPQPFALAANQTLKVSVDGGGDQTFTFLATAGTTDSGASTYNLVSGDDLQLSVNDGNPQSFSFVGTRGYYQGSAGTFASLDTTTLSFKRNGGGAQTVTFDVTCLDAATTAAYITANATGVTTLVINGQIRILSTTYGTGSTIEITAANAAAGFPSLGLGVGGTGDAVNLAAITNAEVAAKMTATIVGATAVVSTSVVRVTSTRLGTSSKIQFTGGTARTKLGFDNTVHSGTGSAADISAVTANEVRTLVTATISGATASVVTLADSSVRVRITSSTSGASSSIQVQSSGTATGLGFDNVLHTGAAAVPGDNLTLTWSSYPKLSDLINYLTGTGKWLITSITSSPGSWDNTNYDAVTNVDVTTLGVAYAVNWDIQDWISSVSTLISATWTKGQSAVTPFADFFLTGGSRGSASNADYLQALDRLKAITKNQVIALISSDGVSPDTYTAASVLAGGVSHCRQQSGPAGRNECQFWFGMQASKSVLVSTANLYNSEHLCLSGQQARVVRQQDGNVAWFPEWMHAAILAGMRSGAPPATPLTWKYMNVLGLRPSDNSWDQTNSDDIALFDINGVMCTTPVQGSGFRIEKGITTYTKLPENAALESEVIVQAWKRVARGLRVALENQYIGTSANLARLQTIPGFVGSTLEPYRQDGTLSDSIENGVQVHAYHDIHVTASGDLVYVDATLHFPDGINYMLTTLFAKPVNYSASL